MTQQDALKMNIEIVNLSDHKELIPVISEWVHSEWGNISGRTFEQTVLRYSEGKHDGLPVILLALADDEPAGIINLREKEDFLMSLTNLSPWITDVYVKQDYRGKGIGSTLMTAAIRKAGALGFKEIYLATEDQQGLYRRHGFGTIDQASIGAGIKVDVMKLELLPG